MRLFVFSLFDAWGWLRRLGGLGLILMGLLDSSLIPTPGGLDLLTVLLATGQQDWWPYYAAMAVAGSVLGGYVTYGLGRKGGEQALEEKLSKRKFRRLYRSFEKWGFGAVFVPALMPPPVPLGPFLLGAGALNYPLKKFLLALGLGRSLRYAGLAYLASRYGHWIVGIFSENYRLVLWLFVGAMVAAAAAFLLYRARRRASAPA